MAIFEKDPSAPLGDVIVSVAGRTYIIRDGVTTEVRNKDAISILLVIPDVRLVGDLNEDYEVIESPRPLYYLGDPDNGQVAQYIDGTWLPRTVSGGGGAPGARGTRGLPGESGRIAGLGSSRPGYGGVPDFTNLTAEAGRRVVILHAWRTIERDLVRGIEPNALILCYRNLTRVADPVETFTEWGPRAATGLTLAQATAAGWASATADDDAGLNARVALIDRPGYAEAWTAAVLDVVHETAGVGGWDGVFLDDVVNDGDATSEVADWEAAQQTLVEHVGPALRARGLVTIANMCGTWGENRAVADPLLPYLDGGYDEYFAMWPGGNREQGYAQAGDSAAAQANCLAQGKIHIAASPVIDGSDEAGALYAFYMALLGTDQSSRSSWAAWTAGYDDPPLIPAGLPDARRLGLPLAPAERAGAGWKRTFQEGIVRVNSSSTRATIDGVSLEAFSGAIAWLPSIVVPAPPSGATGVYLRADNGVLTWAS